MNWMDFAFGVTICFACFACVSFSIALISFMSLAKSRTNEQK